LLLSLFNSEKLKSNNDDDENKVQEAKERIKRWFRFICQHLNEVSWLKRIFRQYNGVNHIKKGTVIRIETHDEIIGKYILNFTITLILLIFK
jgi:hypothetical protein